MKHKYSIIVNEEKNELVIKEYGELDKEILSLLCEETYDWQALRAAAETGRSALIGQLRTPNLYPPSTYINRIADAVLDIKAGELAASEPQELHFDDLEQLSRDEAAMLVGDIDEESEDLEGLLEDELEDEVDDETDEEIKNKAINTSIKVADDLNGEIGGE